jgi:hypothetical protein
VSIHDPGTPATPGGTDSQPIKLSAVHYVHFQFNPEQVDAFKDMTQPAAIVVSHPNYKHRTELPQNIRESLREDLSWDFPV